MSARVPQHGTLTEYTTYGCRCLPCRLANAEYQRQWQAERRAGGRRLTNAAPCREHLRVLLDSGMTLWSIAAACGLSDAALSKVISGKSRRVRWSSHHAIMGVRTATLVPGHRVPADIARRLLRELYAAGLTHKRVEAITGRMLSIRPDARWVFWHNYDRLLTLFRLLAAQGAVDAAVLDEVT